MVLVAIAFVIRSFGGSSSSPFPDPAVDVALGVASAIGTTRPAQPVGAPTAAADRPRGQQRPALDRPRSRR